MINTIISFYKGAFKVGIWLTGIAIMNFTLGILAVANWGDVGAGILVIFGGFAIYQIIWGLWILLAEQNRTARKVLAFENDANKFIASEIQHLEKAALSEKNKTTYKIISFLVGLLCLFMGAFGNWNQIIMGIGVGLALQSGIMLIIGLLDDYQATFYLQRLKKHQSTHVDD